MSLLILLLFFVFIHGDLRQLKTFMFAQYWRWYPSTLPVCSVNLLFICFHWGNALQFRVQCIHACL